MCVCVCVCVCACVCVCVPSVDAGCHRRCCPVSQVPVQQRGASPFAALGHPHTHQLPQSRPHTSNMSTDHSSLTYHLTAEGPRDPHTTKGLPKWSLPLVVPQRVKAIAAAIHTCTYTHMAPRTAQYSVVPLTDK